MTHVIHALLISLILVLCALTVVMIVAYQQRTSAYEMFVAGMLFGVHHMRCGLAHGGDRFPALTAEILDRVYQVYPTRALAPEGVGCDELAAMMRGE